MILYTRKSLRSIIKSTNHADNLKHCTKNMYMEHHLAETLKLYFVCSQNFPSRNRLWPLTTLIVFTEIGINGFDGKTNRKCAPSTGTCMIDINLCTRCSHAIHLSPSRAQPNCVRGLAPNTEASETSFHCKMLYKLGYYRQNGASQYYS